MARYGISEHKTQAGSVAECGLIRPRALGFISSAYNLAWWFLHLLSELGGRQEGQKIKVARDCGSLCLKTRDSSVTSTAPAQGSLNS